MSADDLTTSNFADEADDTRGRIAATIDELQDRLSPRRIVGDAVGSIQSSGSDLIDSGIRMLRGHPVAAIAAGLAVGIVVLGGSKLKAAKVDFGDDRESFSDFDDDYRSGESTGNERFALLRSRSGSTIEENPVIAVLVGLAAGALLGVLFPETEKERELLGASGDRLAKAARAAADAAREEFGTARAKVADVVDHAKGAVGSVVDTAKREYGERA